MFIAISRNMSAEEIRKALERLPAGKLLPASKHCGGMILQEDPLVYQKRLRDECPHRRFLKQKIPVSI